LSGEIPFSICQLQVLWILDLSKNMLSGELPNCWNNSSPIEVMDFSRNNISGVIPESICSLVSLQSLHLSNNSLSGELPLSLKDCGKLILLDAGHNDLKGEIQTWIGESLTSLRFLNLRSNMLAGDVPPNLSRLSALQFLDLADNELSGTIPRSFGNFTAMKVIENFSSWRTGQIRYKEQMFITTKGNTRAYDVSLSLINILDLSDNNLFGGVPEELTSLFGLFSLNLSGNHFTGEIIENISKLQQLESLDLSRNNFSGTIPSSLAALTSLAHLNLSYNNLSGEIPLGNQLLTFNDPSIYIGNPGLCGFPLNQSCKDNETAQGRSNADDRDDNEMIWFYMSMAPGFVVGFWAVWGTLILNKNWNLYYFRFIDNILDKVYVVYVLFYLLAFLCIQLIKPNVCDGALTSGCIPAERSALLEFKRGLKDPTNRLSSWVGEDCCKWEGVTCSNHTGHVVKLDLHNPPPLSYLPLSLKGCTKLVLLDAGHNDLKGEIPTWIGESLTSLRFLNLRSNMLDGDIPPNLSKLSALQFIDLADNKLSGSIPRSFGNFTAMKVNGKFSSRMTDATSYKEQMLVTTKGQTQDYKKSLSLMNILDLSDNNLFGEVLEELTSLSGLFSLNLSGNYFTGEIIENISKLQQLDGQIPFSVCQLQALQVLDLSKNTLSGVLPNCWNNSSGIVIMDFSSNNISGVIPKSICSMASLQSLHLNNNSLYEELSLSLKDCTKLVILDAGHNDLKGEIPTWIGESLTSLRFLNLRSNMLVGDIPPNLSRLSSLQFLDLADNELSGTIPRSFGNFTAMKVIENFSSSTTDQIRYKEHMFITTKGNTLSYDESLLLMNILDLSDNNLFGGVPEEVTGLFGLFSLNLSGNHFTGEIIENISKLQQLESLDLSRNNFSGTIPSGLVALTYLAHLNLSYNNLSGEIPLGNQLLTFTDPSIYIGNPGLCGFPLNQSCKDSETTQGQSNSDDGDENEMIWFYTSMALGFVVGFWAVWGTLILNKNWNLYYFRFIDNMFDKVYV
ncbi:unnamed protein product, partial [Musa acuminata subsp. malaccensis]